MNQKDRDILIQVIDSLRTIHTPSNPADIRNTVLYLQKAEKIARNSAFIVENCEYKEYDLALEDANNLRNI